MKIILNLLSAATLIALTFVTNSCNDALNLVEPGKEIPVIYGFLSLNDTATYIRVERAFVDTKKGAAEIAQIPDSLYYPISTTVTLIRAKDNTKFVLDRVDGNLEGYKRAAGIFATSPNYLYKIKNTRLAMKADEEWRVEVEKAGETKPIATGVTRVIGNYEIIGPTTARALFVTTDNAFPVTFETTTDVTAKFYAVNVVFNYADSTATQVTPQSVTWQFTTS